MEDRLRECPCGCTDVALRFDEYGGCGYYKSKEPWTVFCANMDCWWSFGWFATKECARAAWNTRATDPPEDITGFAHELWALAQLMPEEGILDGVMRIEEALQGEDQGNERPADGEDG